MYIYYKRRYRFERAVPRQLLYPFDRCWKRNRTSQISLRVGVGQQGHFNEVQIDGR